jgi:tRNA-Thr(GGU) m(6)t(6)A37 methyltransferase TsaA
MDTPPESNMRTIESNALKSLATACALLLFAMVAQADETFTMHPIGHVAKEDGVARIVLDPGYRDGLLGLDEFSHVWVIFWFDQNDTPERRAILQVHPRRDPRNPLSGVFATRAPVRPNLIGLTLCRIVSVRDGVVEVDDIDAFDGTPVLDLKPYIPPESVSDTKTPRRF